MTKKKSRLLLGSVLAICLIGTMQPNASYASACLASGDPATVQGASVATFQVLGIDPTVT